ncbi:GGDEF domain-containing protein [Aestuariibacter halophilus]|uniref:diguanylate cyclase n=1 Tax=Fluctibacter halophilus TaxID=226011 RepID=A0ABS8G620_9ALTE|nr:GGDEF domain-containing protein [Aestuariibacter halophilus]MCC2616042.1 GGDEF domain-containing protein [Aestuariibacter halophilus]
MAFVVPSGSLAALLTNLLVCLLFLSLYRRSENATALLYWAASCGLFVVGGLCYAVHVTLQPEFSAFKLIGIASLITSSACLFLGIRCFEAGTCPANNVFFLLLVAGGSLSLYLLLKAVLGSADGMASLIMALFFILSAQRLKTDACQFTSGRWVLRVLLQLHAAVMICQGLTLLRLPQGAYYTTDHPLIQPVLLTHLMLTIATALVLPLIHSMRQNAVWQKLASIDDLTQCLNRRAFLSKAAQQSASLATLEKPVTVLMLDVDHFKRINDCYGHLVGDRVLQQVGRAISKALPDSALFGRLGGEEFAVFLPLTQQAAEQVVNCLHNAVRQHPMRHQGSTIAVTISVGAASANHGQVPFETLLAMADDALYGVKDAGRDGSQFANPEDNKPKPLCIING